MKQQNKKILSSSVFIIKKINKKAFEGGVVSGEITLEEVDIKQIENIKKGVLIELFTVDYSSIDIEDLGDHLNDVLKIEIKVGDILNYYNSIKDFISGNKFECKYSDFYIEDIDYREGIDINKLLDNYKKNLLIIDFLQNIAENKKRNGHQLELFFYKSGKGADLKIEYDFSHMTDLKLSVPHDFRTQLLDSFSGNDKKQLFINELIVFVEKNGNSFIKLIQNWDNLIANYEKSYSLFIAGFSFEKIKTASNEHFQKLVDRIYDSIGKASNYIFGIPIGYILLINNFDFNGVLRLKNFALMILASIFLVLIWCVLFKNIAETIDAIAEDITDFLKKIKDVKELKEISDRLEKIQNDVLKKQRFKLNLVMVLTSAIYAITFFIYLFVLIDVSIYV